MRFILGAWARSFVVVSVVVWGLVATVGYGQDASKVFDTMSPSVALLTDAEGHGSGVVVKAGGVILTNLHVVLSPLPREAEVAVRIDGKIERRTLKVTGLIGVHPEYDAALIRVELPEGGELIPPSFRRDPLKPGEPCYIIGNPAAGEATLRNSITAGIISAVDQRFEGLDYIQTTAPMNPGNSGGPLCDAEGRLLGIVTFKLLDTEGIGFAIGIEKISAVEPIPLKDRKPDLKRMEEYKEIGSKLARESQFSRDPEERELLRALAYFCYHQCLVAAPAVSTPYIYIGALYMDEKEYTLARAYFAQAHELDPESAVALLWLGRAAAARDDGKAARDYWRRGLVCRGPEGAVRDCILRYAAFCLEQKEDRAAAYLARWGQTLDPRRSSVASDWDKVFARAARQLPPEDVATLREKAADFTLENMERFVGAGGVTWQANAEDQKALDLLLRSGHKAAVQHAAELQEAAPEIGIEGGVKALPDVVVDSHPASNGAYLLLRFAGLPKLAVFDTLGGRIVRYIPLQDVDFVYAAGDMTLAIHYPRLGSFEIWSLATFECVLEHWPRIDGVIHRMEMGLANGRHIFLVLHDGKQDVELGVLDISSWRYKSLAKNRLGDRMLSSSSRISVNDHGTVMTVWQRDGIGAGIVSQMQAEAPTIRDSMGTSQRGHLLPDAGGKRFYAADGVVMDANAKVVRKAPEVPGELIPIRGSSGYLSVVPGRSLVVCNADGWEADRIALGREMPKIDRREVFPSLLRDRMVFASAAVGRVVVIHNEAAEIRFYPLGRPRASTPVRTVARAGEDWSMDLGLPKGSRATVEDGPPGISFRAGDGRLIWQVPAGTKAGEYRVLISVVEPERPEYYRDVDITVEGVRQ